MSNARAVIVRNLAVLDEASSLLQHKMEPEVFAAIDELAKKWVEKRKWRGKFNFLKDELWIAPPNWLSEPDNDDSVFAWFEFHAGEGDDIGESENWAFYWLTRLCALRTGELGLRLALENTKLGITGNKPKWRQFLFSRATPFIEHGFKVEEREGRLFLPVRVDQGLLAKAYEDESMEEALIPFSEALERIDICLPLVEKLLNDTKEQFGAKSMN
jgi:hypothetical protein